VCRSDLVHLDGQTVIRHAYPRTAKNLDILTKYGLHHHSTVWSVCVKLQAC
jgi:hypothetical protein